MSAAAKINTKDVAREALRALVLRRLDPSPENYRRLFNEIAGIESEPETGGADEMLGRIATGFPRNSPEMLRLAKAMERAAAKGDWPQYANLLNEVATALARHHSSGETWRGLLSDLLHLEPVARLQSGIVQRFQGLRQNLQPNLPRQPQHGDTDAVLRGDRSDDRARSQVRIGGDATPIRLTPQKYGRKKDQQNGCALTCRRMGASNRRDSYAASPPECRNQRSYQREKPGGRASILLSSPRNASGK